MFCGDMNYTPREDVVEMVWGDRAENLPKDLDGKWNKAPKVRDMLLAQNWPSSMTTARPRTEREWTTRRDWKDSAPARIDYIMYGGIEMSRYDTLFVEGIPSDHALMITTTGTGAGAGQLRDASDLQTRTLGSARSDKNDCRDDNF